VRFVEAFEFFESVPKVCFSKLDTFDELVNFPQPPEVVVRWFNALDMDELIKFVVFPKCAGEGGGADEKTPVYAEHAGDVAEMPFDPFAGGSAFMQGATELDDEADALAVVVL